MNNESGETDNALKKIVDSILIKLSDYSNKLNDSKDELNKLIYTLKAVNSTVVTIKNLEEISSILRKSLFKSQDAQQPNELHDNSSVRKNPKPLEIPEELTKNDHDLLESLRKDIDSIPIVSRCLKLIDKQNPNQRLRFEIAKIAASQDGFGTSRNIKKFGIVDQRLMHQIFAIAIKNKGCLIISHILDNFIKAGQIALKVSPYFEILREKILNGENNKQIIVEVEHWLSFYKSICAFFNLTEKEIVERDFWAFDIGSHRDPEMRYSLTHLLAQKELPQYAESVHIRLLRLVFKTFFSDKNSNLNLQKKIESFIKGKECKDGAKRMVIIRGLISLLDNIQLSHLDKLELLNHIFVDNNRKDDISVAFQLLNAILTSDSPQFLMASQAQLKQSDEKDMKSALESSLLRPIDLGKVINDIFTKYIVLPKDANFVKKYQAVLSASRDQTALFVYATRLSGLSNQEMQQCHGVLRNFILAIVEGEENYKNWRYRGKHLDQIFKARSDLIPSWQQNTKRILPEIDVKEAGARPELNIREYLQNKIKAGHLKETELPDFQDYLKNSNPAIKEKLLKSITGGKIQGKVYDPNDIGSKHAFESKMQFQLIQLLEAKDNNEIAKCANQVLKLLETRLGKDNIFFRDINALALPTTQKAGKIYSIENTDRWDDLLLIGTEVASCQNIHRDVYFNKCLLGYLADGKYRVIAAKNSEGRIVARCIMRLLWDDIKKSPVIFQEELYYNPGTPQYVLKAINDQFVEYAINLRLPLVMSKDNKIQGSNYPNNLISLSCQAPFEYLDVGNMGIQDVGGQYTIQSKDMIQVYDPK